MTKLNESAINNKVEKTVRGTNTLTGDSNLYDSGNKIENEDRRRNKKGTFLSAMTVFLLEFKKLFNK